MMLGLCCSGLDADVVFNLRDQLFDVNDIGDGGADGIQLGLC